MPTRYVVTHIAGNGAHIHSGRTGILQDEFDPYANLLLDSEHGPDAPDHRIFSIPVAPEEIEAIGEDDLPAPKPKEKSATEAELKLRIFELEQGIEASRNMILFLHGCLTKPTSYSYEYPIMTEELIEELDYLYPPRPFCVHSKYEEGCESCIERVERWERGAKLMEEVNE